MLFVKQEEYKCERKCGSASILCRFLCGFVQIRNYIYSVFATLSASASPHHLPNQGVSAIPYCDLHADAICAGISPRLPADAHTVLQLSRMPEGGGRRPRVGVCVCSGNGGPREVRLTCGRWSSLTLWRCFVTAQRSTVTSTQVGRRPFEKKVPSWQVNLVHSN